MIEMFINFCNKIFDFEVFDIKLYDYLIAFTIIIFIFKIISILSGGSKKKGDK